VKDPLEDLLQSVEAIGLAYAQALCVDAQRLSEAQEANDAALAQELLQDAFRTDLRPLVAEARSREGGALRPLGFFRENAVRERLVKERGSETKATGL
jgi:L-rhamnose isomerase/sugar isomerase